MRARNAAALVLLLSLSCCATQGELALVANALNSVHDDLAALKTDGSPAAVEKATKSVEAAAATVEVVGKTVAERTGEVLAGAAKGMTAAETGGLSGLITLVGMLATWIFRNKTRADALTKATGKAPPSA